MICNGNMQQSGVPHHGAAKYSAMKQCMHNERDVVQLISFSVDEILLLGYMSWSTDFKGLPLKVEIVPCLKHTNSVLFALKKRLMFLAVCTRLCNRDSDSANVFT